MFRYTRAIGRFYILYATILASDVFHWAGHIAILMGPLSVPIGIGRFWPLALATGLPPASSIITSEIAGLGLGESHG